MKALVLIPIAVVCYIWALMLGQFGPYGMKLANLVGFYAGLLVAISLVPTRWLGWAAKPLILVPPMLIVLYALATRK